MPNGTTGVSPTFLVLAYNPKDVLRNEIIAVIGTEEKEAHEVDTFEKVLNATKKEQIVKRYT